LKKQQPKLPSKVSATLHTLQHWWVADEYRQRYMHNDLETALFDIIRQSLNLPACKYKKPG
jgi:hypothetical protein